ncbi:hypothetical protein ACKWTF_010775 [Chironomus riparius]
MLSNFSRNNVYKNELELLRYGCYGLYIAHRNIEKTDAELFKVDKTPNLRTTSARLEKKLRAQEPSKCFISLENNSKVQDPITKRNRVRTLEERKHPLLKAKIKRNKELGIIPERKLQSMTDRIAASKKVIVTKEKEIDFQKDLWDGEEEGMKENPELASSWVNKDLKQYHLKNLGIDTVKVPQITYERRSQLKAIDVLPGTSYNPNKEDYDSLIGAVVEKEAAHMKQSEKLNRSLKAVYQKTTKSELKRRKRTEMREGFPTNGPIRDDDEQPSGDEYKTTNPPVRNRKKDLMKRRKQKEHRLRMAQAEKDKTELKKIKDLGMLKMYKKQIKKNEEVLIERKEDRAVKQELKKKQPRRLARKKFEEEDIQVEDNPEDLGNLRKLKPLGSILVDRFKSMQKRNILVPNVKRMPRKRRLVRIKKNAFKEEVPQSKKSKKGPKQKLKIHD